MLEALERELPDGRAGAAPRAATSSGSICRQEWTRPSCSYKPSEDGVTFVKGTDFFAGPGGESSARLAFSFASPDEIIAGIGKLGSAVGRLRAPAAAPA